MSSVFGIGVYNVRCVNDSGMRVGRRRRSSEESRRCSSHSYSRPNVGNLVRLGPSERIMQRKRERERERESERERN